MTEINQFWIGVASNIGVAMGLLFLWFKITSYVKTELKDMESNVSKKLTKEEGEILGNHSEDIKAIKKVLSASEDSYKDREKFVDDRHKIDKDENDEEHADISKRLDDLSVTARLNVKSNSMILRILLPMANGISSDVKEMAKEIDGYLLSKIK